MCERVVQKGGKLGFGVLHLPQKSNDSNAFETVLGREMAFFVGFHSCTQIEDGFCVWKRNKKKRRINGNVGESFLFTKKNKRCGSVELKMISFLEVGVKKKQPLSEGKK